MPKNIIPKDNIPKIFEVREVESEIPSYEEFLKSYQREEVNYEDLSYSDVSSSKTYGPMYRASSTENTERWANLYIWCPANNCTNKNVAHWFHSNEGNFLAIGQPTSICGTLKISTQARIKCDGCRIVSRFDNWKFKCSSQRDYRDVSIDSFMKVLNVVGDPNDFIRDLMRYLINNC